MIFVPYILFVDFNVYLIQHYEKFISKYFVKFECCLNLKIFFLTNCSNYNFIM